MQTRGGNETNREEVAPEETEDTKVVLYYT